MPKVLPVMNRFMVLYFLDPLVSLSHPNCTTSPFRYLNLILDTREGFHIIFCTRPFEKWYTYLGISAAGKELVPFIHAPDNSCRTTCKDSCTFSSSIIVIVSYIALDVTDSNGVAFIIRESGRFYCISRIPRCSGAAISYCTLFCWLRTINAGHFHCGIQCVFICTFSHISLWCIKIRRMIGDVRSILDCDYFVFS